MFQAKYEKLDVWQESIVLTEDIYKLLQSFPKSELFGMISQLKRCSVSIPSNIAEGSLRGSDKEFIRFLYIALGSIGELHTQLILSEKLGYIKSNTFDISRIHSLRKKLYSLISSIRKNLS